MKVLLVNGSQHEKGCTYTALSEVAKALNANGVETEIYWIGQNQTSGCKGCCHLEKRISELFANDVSEITIPELNSTYTSDPPQVTKLMEDVTKYYEKVSTQQNDLMVSATVVVDEEVTNDKGCLNNSELLNSEKFIQRYKNFMNVVTFILGIGSLFGIILADNWVTMLVIFLCLIAIIIHVWISNNVLSHMIDTSKAVRWLYNKTQK